MIMTLFKNLLFFHLIFFVVLVNAQDLEEFKDTNLLRNVQWTGQLQSFKIENERLKSNHNVANSGFYLASQNKSKVINEWHIDVNLLFNTSSANYVDYVIKSDSLNLLLSKTNYLIRLGGVSDDISLIKTLNGIETKLIDGENGFLNASSSYCKVILKQYKDSFQLSRLDYKTNLIKIEGFVNDSSLDLPNTIGLRIRQSTSSFFNKHFFDNLYAGPIIWDTISPVVDSIKWLNQQQVSIFLSEVCDTLSLKNKSNYEVENYGFAGNVTILNKGKSILVDFDSILPFNRLLNLSIKNIADLEGNLLDSINYRFKIYKTQNPQSFDLIINEMMVDPDPSIGLPSREYIEIYNRSNKFIQLNQCFISDHTQSIRLPFFILEPDSILVLYQIPSLNNTSDKIWLSDSSGQVIHQVNYTDEWYKNDLKKNGGYSLEMIDPNKICLRAENWMASSSLSGGTPGVINSVKTDLPIDTIAPSVIHLFPLNNDSILVFTMSELVDTNSIVNLIIKLNQQIFSFKVISYNELSNKLTIKIDFSPDKKIKYQLEILGLADCIGNIQNQKINWQWPSVAQKSDVIVNEILFNPRTGGKDFIEFYNKSEYAIDISTLFLVEIDEFGQYEKVLSIEKENRLLPPKTFLLLSEDTNNICQFYTCGTINSIKKQMSKLPTMPDSEGRFLLVNQQDLIIDSLFYSETWHLNLISNKEGISLERISYQTPTQKSSNWFSASNLSGNATPGRINSQFQKQENEAERYFSSGQMTISPDSDGFEDYVSINYQLPFSDFVATMQIYDQEGRFINTIINNELIGREGFVKWDGTDFNNQKTTIGKYIILITAFSLEGKKVLKEKIPVIVATQF
jgi:hypothetical protein